MEYALIRNGIVHNVIVADVDFIQNIQNDWDHIERIDTPQEIALGVGIGWGWNGTSFVAPPAPPEPEAPVPPVYVNYIDIGPFFDRFKAQKLPVLINQDPTIKALLSDIQIRKWIDLSLPEVQQAVGYIATVIPAVAPLVPSILATPVQDHENLALRKLYFS